MNTEKLRLLFEQSTDKYGDAKKMGTTYQTMMNAISKGVDLRVSTLEKIARFYGVPVGYFFDEADVDGRPSHELEIERLKGQIEGLMEALDKLASKRRKKITEQ